ncbi:hypothetical protein ACJMK2_016750 [Sinanodonta woodiana]|uniref:Cytochrome P450 n=1 Tax=Sinanodonta woodiana TaxID=1069815 RepID=A0ABD3UVQ2_SINWO
MKKGICGYLRLCYHGEGLQSITKFNLSTAASVDRAESAQYESAKPFSEIPGPKGLPYLGTLLEYRQGPFKKFDIDRLQDALLARYKEYGRIMKEAIGSTTVVHLFDPEYVKVIFQSEGKMPYIVPLMETTQRYRQQRGLSPGLGNTNGEEWYRLRSAVQQMMMRPKAVSVYLPLVEEVVNDFVKKLAKIRDANFEVPDLKNEVAKWNLESSGMTVFETRLGCLNAGPNSEAQKMIDANTTMFTLSTKLQFSLPFFRYLNTPTWRKLVEAEDFFFYRTGQSYVERTISKIKDLVNKGQYQEGQYNFLTYLMSKKELSYKDVTIITLSLFGDGLSTTVPTFVSILYCMASNPEVQQKVYEEICEMVPQSGPITPEIINKLIYLKAAVKEAFRFFPIGLDVARIPQQNLVIGGYQIPAGTHVEMNNFVMFKDPQYFVEPHKFMPERWLRDGSAHNIHPYILMPFGHGPRMCAGRRFAEQEMYVLLTRILQRFKLQWHYPEMGQTFKMLMVPNCPVRVTFLDRKN